MPQRAGAVISIEVILRILRALETSGPIKRTNLAAKSALNYAILVRYTKLLRALSWITITVEPGGNLIRLTIAGKDAVEILSAYLDEPDNNTPISDPQVEITARLNQA